MPQLGMGDGDGDGAAVVNSPSKSVSLRNAMKQPTQRGVSGAFTRAAMFLAASLLVGVSFLLGFAIRVHARAPQSGAGSGTAAKIVELSLNDEVEPLIA